MADKTLGACNIFDLRDMARRRVPKGLFEFAPLQASPEVVDAVGHRVPVLVDSGYRRGSDIVKSLGEARGVKMRQAAAR